MKNELYFVYNNLGTFFSAEVEYRVLHDVIAPGNDWEFSIHLESCAYTPLTNSMLLELANFTTALPKSALKVQIQEMYKSLQQSVSYTHIYTKHSPGRFLSCTVFAMNKLFEWNISSSVLSNINNLFPLMNDVGLSFGMLSLVKVIYKNLD